MTRCISRSYSMRSGIHTPGRLYLLIFGLCIATAAAHGQGSNAARKAEADPATLPAHDSHQGLLIAADPYTSADRYKEKFGKHSPYDGGILAIDLFFRNDDDSPIRINLKTIQLLMAAPGESRQRLEPLAPDEVADRVLAKPKDPSPRLPIPRIGAPPPKHDKTWEAFAEMLRSSAMGTDLIAPHTTAHGFVYFDIDRHYEWLSSGRLEIPDLAFMTDTKPLFFFEIDLAPAVR